MMRTGSLGLSKKLMTSKSINAAEALESPRVGRKLEKTNSGQNFISRLTSMGSLKSRRTKSGVPLQAVQAPSRPTSACDSELAELEMAFKVFDANGDGQICIAELGAVLRSLGGEVSEHELRLIMDEADTNHDGFICLEEFKAVNKSTLPNRIGDAGSPTEDPIREAFATFDKDGNNLISADELRAVLQSLGDKGHSLEDCRKMISHVDQDGDGFVDYKEFESLLSTSV